MNQSILGIHETIDLQVAGALARDGHPVPCKQGCFFCCKESVQACLSEVRNILETLSEDAKADLAIKTRNWLTKFLATGLQAYREPWQGHYRPHNLWCPLLKNGECSAYAHRPLSCRMHVAFETNEGCEHDDKRQNQKFALFPALDEYFLTARLQGLKDGEEEIVDHLGILLARELLGEDHPSNGRVRVVAQGTQLIMEHYEEDQVCASK
jgi:Fe-S-cluster containining protein